MKPFEVRSPAEQASQHLRQEILAGSWSEYLPGEAALAAELGVGRDTISGAVKILAKQGLVISQGAGKRRRVKAPSKKPAPSWQVEILCFESTDRHLDYILDVFYGLIARGHQVKFSPKSLQEMKMDPNRVARHVKRSNAGAWVVVAGSNEVLRWFSQHDIPAIALYGRIESLKIAAVGVKITPVYRSIVKRLAKLGHERIVKLSRYETRFPNPSLIERALLEELHAQGLPVSDYNLPVWDGSFNDFHRCLDSLFQISPPTAVIFNQPDLFLAGQAHLSQRGVIAPRDVSLISMGELPVFAWHDPPISHAQFDTSPIVKTILGWMDKISIGQADTRQVSIPAVLIEGGTIGAAPKG
ncbi:MAG: substrate-binding domain-containing protein [Verrucomicrobiae bacterium]|nr:substrate-binding domain-containing protein [Verrucomicrobiae bacterium]NNJ43396.1 substrate-binding domain-containing protein [Akkermansiaceae bacterium]